MKSYFARSQALSLIVPISEWLLVQANCLKLRKEKVEGKRGTNE